MKAKSRFNFTDIVLILAILVIISGFLFRKPIEKLIEDVYFKTDVTYTVQADAEPALNLGPGKELFDTNGVSLGTVSKIQFFTSDTTTLSRITIITQGMTDNSGTYVGDKMFIAPGVNINFKTKDGLHLQGTVKIVKTDSAK